MENLFVPYKESIALKDLGFDEPCMGYYIYNVIGDYPPSFHYHKPNVDCPWNPLCLNSLHPSELTTNAPRVSAPTWDQAFTWFREKKLSDACICRYQSRDDGGIYYYYVIDHDFGVEETRHFKEHFYSYEEAQLACIQKLIEIIKNKIQ